VWEGNSYLCKQTRDILYQSDSGLQAIPVITRREKEVLGLIALGYTTSEIGEKLFVSSHTVESHRKNLMEKFNAKSMPAIIKLATAYKLI
ncbi:MAG TPA: helix-turn-helix transcriptional regulator, partial [Candidatus Sphingobacterium stercorigallinarum]|nr:helix-turn-helix transcriptional regulator [Candidatus Sphingobacterium stercorigallinarum]